ncbi:MAG TPA: carbohydrate ABC transporter permease [Ruminiclostridium sp.]
MQKDYKGKSSNLIIKIVLAILSILTILPLLYLISVSFSTNAGIVKYGYTLIPRDFTLEGYKFIFKVPKPIITGYLVTITVTILGTALGLILSSSLAYVMSRRDYRYSRFTSLFVFFTMLFNGGLVPTYMLMTKFFHVQNTIWALIIPYSISPWFTMIMKGFMQTLPFEIVESAKIDGAGEFKTFIRIILPVARPAIATVGLFYAFAYWNDWWLAMLYIDKESLIPLQFLLYRTLSNLSYMLNNMSSLLNVNIGNIPSESVRMGMAVLAAGPMLILFPFFQKHFVKGLTVGSVKG